MSQEGGDRSFPRAAAGASRLFYLLQVKMVIGRWGPAARGKDCRNGR